MAGRLLRKKLSPSEIKSSKKHLDFSEENSKNFSPRAERADQIMNYLQLPIDDPFFPSVHQSIATNWEALQDLAPMTQGPWS